MESMAHLNRNAAKLMNKYKSHGATDITGFGMLGHAQNLVNVQHEGPLDFIIHSLPLIEHTKAINDNVLNFKLTTGYSAETSGGIFCMLDKSTVRDFQSELLEKYGQESWVVGEVTRA